MTIKTPISSGPVHGTLLSTDQRIITKGDAQIYNNGTARNLTFEIASAYLGDLPSSAILDVPPLRYEVAELILSNSYPWVISGKLVKDIRGA